MKTDILIQKNTIIQAGNFLVSIGTHNIEEVAIISKHTGEFVKFKHIRKGSILSKLKRKFKQNLCSDIDFCFSFMQPETTKNLINFLKS